MNRGLKMIGWIPPKQGILRYVYLFWTCIAMGVSVIYLPIGFSLSLFKNFQHFTPGEFLDVLQVTLNALGMTIKSIIVLILFSHLQNTESHLDKLDEHLQTDKDRWKIHKAVALCNYVFFVYGNVYLGFVISMLVSGVWLGQPPMMVYNPIFNWRDGVIKLWIQTILEHIIVSTSSLIILIWDTYTLIFIIIFRAHVNVLKDHIRNLRIDSMKTEVKNYDDLVSCITYHKLILKCCGLIRPVISGTIFVQFLLIGMLLGLTMINIMNFSDKFHVIISIGYLGGIFLQTFPFCYLCDSLVDDSKDLSNLLSQSQWIDAESKYKSTLLIFMHHVQQPIIFIAGGVFTISLTSNFKMAKIAFSVMTLVQQMNLADRLK